MSVFTSDVTVEAGSTSIPVTVGNFPATQPVSGSVAVTQSTSPWVISGSVSTTPSAASTSTVVQITSTGVNQVLLAANANRKKAVLFFASGIWSVKLGIGASSTSFSYQITSNSTTLEVTVWTGEIDAICTTSGKLVNVTELS